MTVVYVRTSYGWEALSMQGPVGPQGPKGDKGDQGIQGDPGTGYPSGEEGTHDFSATGGTYAVPNGAWGNPGWFAPIVVGPNQTWEVTAEAGVYCVTAVGNLSQRLTVLTSGGASSPPGVSWTSFVNQITHPNTTAFARGMYTFGRVKTDGTVVAGTTLRLTQEFFGGDANSRILRDGTYFRYMAWRRI